MYYEMIDSPVHQHNKTTVYMCLVFSISQTYNHNLSRPPGVDLTISGTIDHHYCQCDWVKFKHQFKTMMKFKH